MFPNVRLLIVAMFASIIALSCGLGVFAAFRVNHDPLSRVPPVTAPLQLVTDNTAPPTVTIAPGTPFGSRLRFGEAQIGSAAADAPALRFDRREGIEPPSLSTVGPEPEPTTDAPPQHASEPQAAPVAASDTQAAPVAAASAPAPAAAQEAPAPDAGQDAKTAATADSTPAQAPAQETQAAQAARDAEQGEAAVKTSEPASAAAVPDVAAIEPPADQAQPVEQPAEQTNTAPESATTTEAKASAKTVRKAAAKTQRGTLRNAVKRQRVAAKTHRARRRRARAVAQFNDQNSMFQQPYFQSAPDAFQGQPVKSRRTARKTAGNTAVGGPFVGPTGQ